MAPADIFDLSLSVQSALGAGYLGYATAYAGLRREHRTEDALFISLAFSAVAMVAFRVAGGLVGDGRVWLDAVAGVMAAFAASLLAAAVWRGHGRSAWLKLMSVATIHRDDGLHSAWSVIVQARRSCGQISVQMKNGHVLYLNDRRSFEGTPWDGLYLGGDGAIIMAVEEEDLPDGRSEIREGVVDAAWGTRLTYIPPAEIARVNIRLK